MDMAYIDISNAVVVANDTSNEEADVLVAEVLGYEADSENFESVGDADEEEDVAGSAVEGTVAGRAVEGTASVASSADGVAADDAGDRNVMYLQARVCDTDDEEEDSLAGTAASGSAVEGIASAVTSADGATASAAEGSAAGSAVERTADASAGERCIICLEDCLEARHGRMACCRAHVHVTCITEWFAALTYADRGSSDEDGSEARQRPRCPGCNGRVQRLTLRCLLEGGTTQPKRAAPAFGSDEMIRSLGSGQHGIVPAVTGLDHGVRDPDRNS